MQTQVAIIGGGPAGSACAIFLARLGISSVIIERDTFPRFHIGESLTGGSAELIREMGLEDQMASLGFPVKRGIWGHGPAGFTPFWVPIKVRETAASGLRESHAWQVRRSTFDEMLLRHARERGATVVRGTASTPLLSPDGRAVGVEVILPDQSTARIGSDVLVDASGQRTFFANAGLTGSKHRGRYSRQVAIYSHFTGAIRDTPQWGNILTFFKNKHYWSWFIPLDESRTSIGFVVPGDYYRSRGESKEDFIERELKEFNGNLAGRVADVTRVEEVRATSNYSYHVDDYTGNGWMCIGDAHRFVDPLFSFGLNIGMAEAREAARMIGGFLAGETRGTVRPFAAFERWSDRGLDRAQTMLDGFWETTFYFGMLVRKFEENFIDLFAGRLWDDDDYPAIIAMRERLAEHFAAD
ncbi:MAG: FAD-dependent monooxygenase [Streptosporangiaceae bacterium]|nr:FAD-dependent monooxygenase [Streptosporangiaceae bacterium]